jgi:16S rRNA (guanine966-N2)-methyltransferase
LSRQKTNAIRIIGGRWRSRILHFPDVPGLRPTPDRVRETLFNWLGQRLDGWRCLDLFAGSGALGFEAASRGAAEVVLVERDAKALAALRENVLKLDAAERVRIQPADARSYLDGACGNFDLILLDPPFDSRVCCPECCPWPRHDWRLGVESTPNPATRRRSSQPPV